MGGAQALAPQWGSHSRGQGASRRGAAGGQNRCVLVAAVNLHVDATVLLKEEDDLDMMKVRLEPGGLPGTLAARILPLNLLLSLFCYCIYGCPGG